MNTPGQNFVPIIFPLMFGGKKKVFKFDMTKATFTAAMAKRATSPFAASPIVQGLKDGTGTPDVLSLSRGAAVIAGTGFYPNFDTNQGDLTFFWTPEYSSGGIASNYHYFMYASSTFFFAYDYTNAWYYMKVGNQALTVASAVAAGTKYTLSFAWNCNNFIDGTNYARVSINDAHTFGITTKPTLAAPDATMYIGSSGTQFACSGLLQAIALYRRVLWDGTYGVNCGNGDELNLIYAAGAGTDAATILGSWDEVLFIPTNSTVGALTTGVGECHTHPHASNLLTDGWLQSYYGGEPWAVKFNGTSTCIDCGSGATLDDLCAGGAIMQVEAWIRCDINTGGTQKIILKANVAAGWTLQIATNLNLYIDLATTDVSASHTTSLFDGKWHHVLGHYNDTTKVGQVAIDGVWGAASAPGAGAYVGDAASNLLIGKASNNSLYFNGAIGWINIYNNAFYTPGTNFKPPRTPTAPDVEQWLLNEGTGVTATAQVTSPANDGTITAGVWQPQWYAEGTPIVPTSVQGSPNYLVTITDAATIQNLHDGAMTAEGWFRTQKNVAAQRLFYKGTIGTNGWRFAVNLSGFITGDIPCVTTAAASTASNLSINDNRWHLVKFTFDDAGDRKVHLYVDNVETAYALQTAGVGAVVSDIGTNGFISQTALPFSGAHGWIRWSNVVRGAGMISRSTPPDPTDANTMLQFNADEGAGAVLTDMSGEGNNGAMAGTYTWINTGAMDVDSPGARVFGWGDARGSDAVNEGEKITYTGLGVGGNYKVYSLAYSEDGVGQPALTIYDETNAAVIATITGTVTSTEWSPDRLVIAFKLPTVALGAAADCTSISIKRLSATAGNIGWHKAEWFVSLIDDGGYELNVAVTDVGTPTTSDQSNVQVHSGTFSHRIITDAIGEGFRHSPVTVVGKYYRMTAWVYSAANSVLVGSGVTLHNNSTAGLTSTAAASWKRVSFVFRAVAVATDISFLSTAAVQTFYVDDFSVGVLDDVLLTITPASQANSLEGTGIRVDGLDTEPQPITYFVASAGRTQFPYTPRHSAATAALFGNATPVIAHWYGDANNYIILDWSAANTIRLRYNAGGAGVQTGTWDATGAIVAGTQYTFAVWYTAGSMILRVNSVTKITITAAVVFTTIPANAYWGSDNVGAQQGDAVFG